MRPRNLSVFLVVVLLTNFGTDIFGRDLNFGKSQFSDTLGQNRLIVGAVNPNLINWPTFNGVHQTGKINTSFSCFGTFGANFSAKNIQSEWPGIDPSTGFVTPPDSAVEYLYGGDIWVGGIVGDDTLVTVGFDGWQSNSEFAPPNFSPGSRGTVNKIDFIADFSMRAEFTDTSDSRGSYSIFDPNGHRPLNLRVVNRSYAWHTFPLNKIILYDVVITNFGVETIHDGYMGLYFDCDVGSDPQTNYLDDLTGSFRSLGIGYAIDNDGDLGGAFTPATRAFAFKFLDQSFIAKDTSYNWWIGNGAPALDFGPRQRGTAENPFRDFGTGGLGTPEGDANKYYVMRLREWDYDQIYTATIGNTDPIWLPPIQSIVGDFSDGYDTRFLMSIGPFELPVDSSIRIIFSTFTGDLVHTFPGAANYLPYDPASYLSLLYFDDVISSSIKADSLADLILNPQLPPLGLKLVETPSHSFELQWDPWVYNNISGYFIYVSELDLALLPNPGAIPPWWMPDTNSTPARLGNTYKLNVDTLDHDKLYIASISHSFGNTRGQLGSPLNFKLNPQTISPPVASRHAFAEAGGPLTLKWQATPDKSAIDHYNIYKFPNKQSALNGYHPFYDNGYFSQFSPPIDSFQIGAKKYYYYAMEPYAVAGPLDTVYLDDNVVEGEAYLIASADEYGFESEFTIPIISNVVDEMSRDILLLTYSQVTTPNNFTFMDSVYSSYGKILQGFDYDIYVNRDSTSNLNCPTQSPACMDWHDFMKYKMVIVDDHLSEIFFSRAYQDSTDGFVRYLSHGGKLLYFGRLRGYGFMNQLGTVLNYAPIHHEFVNNFLGIDSINIAGERYYFTYTSPPQIDTLFGFVNALSIDTLFESLSADTLRDPFTPRLRNIWTPKTPPGVATFKINDNSTTAMLFNSLYPAQSIQQDHIVGVRRNFPELNTYAYTFGFHLWYMDTTDARNLIRAIFNDSPSSIAGQTHINPSVFFVIEANSLEPRFADILVGNLAQNRTVSDIVPGTIRVNGSIEPTGIEIFPASPGFSGSVLKMQIPLRDFLFSYGFVWGTLNGDFEVTGAFGDGLGIKAVGEVTIIGHRRGDINGDNAVNILDLTILVDHLFRNARLPEPAEAADVDSSGTVNILDLTKLIDFVFRGGNLN